MPIEPYVRLNMLRHWCFVTNMPRRAYTDLTQNNLVPLLPAHYCMSVFILSKHKCALCFVTLLFIFPIPLFNHISNFWFFSWPGDSLLDLIWVKYNFDKLYASEINRMQKYLFLMIYAYFFLRSLCSLSRRFIQKCLKIARGCFFLPLFANPRIVLNFIPDLYPVVL